MDKQKKATAISYDPEKDQAPHLVAAGRGLIAERILEVARSFDIPVREDRNLVNLLEALEIDTDIPEELYRVMAEVLVYIYKLDNEFGDQEAAGTTE
ncbi:MAG: EscU/YscU/HrcU family type III secretion system export apparatus switch protein [Desulfobacterales bacterium]|nr:EscU/YscU/HrcU family type III secretion system export apparatus switch protein [Desulfobacterales bacterium]MDX2510556.1 EscU/YscU/HrcU family type III secretion system export apparatus switch protein [Desulfobacterales bacterium]